MTIHRAARLTGERLPLWVPVVMATVGLIGSVATAELAVADDNSQAAPSPRPTLQATPASEASATTSVPGRDPGGAGDASERVDDEPAEGGVTADDGSSEPANANRGADCPPLFVVLFPFGSARPLSSLGSKPSELAAWMTSHPDARLIVDGHADAAGTEQANLELSFRRAEAAADLLAGAGIDAGRMQTRGFGEYQPVVGAPLDSERNRRVTIQLDGRSDCPLDDKETPE